jgi:hypothetical protein
VSKAVENLKKRIKIFTKPLKVLPVYPSEETSPAKSFFKFLTAEKGFVGTKSFPAVQNLKKGFAGEGSSLGYTGRTFKGFVDIFILF